MNVSAPMAPVLPDTLARILEGKWQEVRQRSAAVPQHEMEKRARGAGPLRDFTGALCAAVAEGASA